MAQISEIQLDELIQRGRFDAEYFHPVAMNIEHKISKMNGKSLVDIGCKVVSGPFGSSLKSHSYLQSGIPFIRISDLKNSFVSDTDLIYISEEDNDRLKSSQVKVGDLVLSKVGNTIGVVSIVTEEIGKSNISENNLGIKFPKDFSDAHRFFILAYLNV